MKQSYTKTHLSTQYMLCKTMISVPTPIADMQNSYTM